jgi:hypothetical protein
MPLESCVKMNCKECQPTKVYDIPKICDGIPESDSCQRRHKLCDQIVKARRKEFDQLEAKLDRKRARERFRDQHGLGHLNPKKRW